MFESQYWDDFCARQNLDRRSETIDPVKDGIIKKLLVPAQYEWLKYAAAFREAPEKPDDIFYVEASLAPPIFYIYKNDDPVQYCGPATTANGLIPSALPKITSASPQALLLFNRIENFWGDFRKPRDKDCYPRSFSKFDLKYLRIVSYSEEELRTSGRWHEMVLHLFDKTVVLFATHDERGVYNLWRQLGCAVIPEPGQMYSYNYDWADFPA